GGAPRRVALEVARYALSAVVTGLVVGFVLLLPLARVLQPMLFHTNLFDPITIASVVVIGAVMSAAAIGAPVRGVLRMDAMEVLREQ
ncbi:MAG TPA: hypothetical protein VH277_11100, partial [Gemmatimonadaceae bacterium]|nr:hypothetical protein [Gemmatimonadaceae bacterium]